MLRPYQPTNWLTHTRRQLAKCAHTRYMKGLYRYWDDVRARATRTLTIDNCASGGNRIDLESLSRTIFLWRNDNDNNILFESTCASHAHAFTSPCLRLSIKFVDQRTRIAQSYAAQLPRHLAPPFSNECKDDRRHPLLCLHTMLTPAVFLQTQHVSGTDPAYQQADTLGLSQFAPVNSGNIHTVNYPNAPDVNRTAIDPYLWRGASMLGGGIRASQSFWNWMVRTFTEH
jgi:hypothetical protein